MSRKFVIKLLTGKSIEYKRTLLPIFEDYEKHLTLLKQVFNIGSSISKLNLTKNIFNKDSFYIMLMKAATRKEKGINFDGRINHFIYNL